MIPDLIEQFVWVGLIQDRGLPTTGTLPGVTTMREISGQSLPVQVNDSSCTTACPSCGTDQNLAECAYTRSADEGLYRCRTADCREPLVLIRPARHAPETEVPGNEVGRWLVYTKADLVIALLPSPDRISVKGHGVPAR